MISVIMSVYNSEKYLNEAIDSILNQTYKDFEFLIVDDCSKDNSLKILEEYSQKDSRIILIKNEGNLGLTKNLNKAIKMSKGDYIARMDADDISETKRFEKQIEFLEKNKGIDIVGTFCSDINEDGIFIRNRTLPTIHSQILKILPKFNPFAHPTVMMRKEKILSIGAYNENYRTSQDYELWFRAIGKGLRVANIPEFLLKYRMNDNYVSRKSIKYRMNDIKLKLEGYKHIRLPYYKYIYLGISIILGILPPKLYSLMKKFDLR